MAQGKQAKILSPKQIALVQKHLEATRYPIRNTLIFLLSAKAGLRVKEITALTWQMVLNANGEIGDCLHLEDKASKGKKGGRIIPLHKDIITALLTYRSTLTPFPYPSPAPQDFIIRSERGRQLNAASLAVWFHRLYAEIGFTGCSSHSGRRTFITNTARKIVEAGGSLRDVQQLAGHNSLSTTQRYIEGDNDAKRKVIELI